MYESIERQMLNEADAVARAERLLTEPPRLITASVVERAERRRQEKVLRQPPMRSGPFRFDLTGLP